jgi:hypothetical protein
MSNVDQQLQDAIRDLYLTQSELESVKQSAGYKLVCRARKVLYVLLPPTSPLGVFNRAIRRALNIWLDEGLAMVCSRSFFKLGRVLRKRLGIHTGGHTDRSENPADAGAFIYPIGSSTAPVLPPIRRLNLVYHVTPIQHPHNVWQWNVGELLKRIHHFNGRRIITVVTPWEGRAMDLPDAVVKAFAGHSVEFRFAPNDMKLREASHFVSAMREIASTDPSEAVFYAHCKGVSHLDQLAVRAWTSAMYHHNLDRIGEVCDLLRRWPCAGIAKRYGDFENLSLGRLRRRWSFHKRPWHGWHFAGTFWWVRHDKLFSQPDWDKLPVHRYAVEAYLANFFKSEEAACLAYDGIEDPYDATIWQDASPDGIHAPSVRLLDEQPDTPPRDIGRSVQGTLSPPMRPAAALALGAVPAALVLSNR